MKIELTTKEANTLVSLLDLVVKAKGLEVAAPALHFYRMFNDAYHQDQHEKEQANKNGPTPPCGEGSGDA